MTWSFMMMLLTHPLTMAGGANFLWITLKALQQRNVAFGSIPLIWAVSYFLAAAEIVMVYTIASTGIVWSLIAVMGTTGALGCLFAIKLHEKYLRRTDQDADLRNKVRPMRRGVGRTISLQGRSSALSEVSKHRD